jgi:hypothetical protein
MSMWLVFASLFAFLSSLQLPSSQAKRGPAGMVFPTAGAPVSLEQVEERTRLSPDGTSETEVLTSKIYRDSAGRMRIEQTVSGPSDKSIVLVQLVDPLACSIVVLTPDKVAARIIAPKCGTNPFAVTFPSLEQTLPPGNWDRKTENLGIRKIEGIEFEGTRTTQTSVDRTSMIAIDERWDSKDLRLTGLASGSGPTGRYTARIQSVDRREPDPSLFLIPSDYRIQDF